MNSNLKAQTKCDIANYYKSLEVNNEVRALTDGDNFVEVKNILVATEIDEAKYSVSLTRKTSNLYKVEGENIFIETRYCYEYASYDDAILVVNNGYGYTKGEIVFIE